MGKRKDHEPQEMRDLRHDGEDDQEHEGRHEQGDAGSQANEAASAAAALAGHPDQGSNDQYDTIPTGGNVDGVDPDNIYSNAGLPVGGNAGHYEQANEPFDGGHYEQTGDPLDSGTSHTAQTQGMDATDHAHVAQAIIQQNGAGIVPHAANSQHTNQGAEAICRLCSVRWTTGRIAALAVVVVLISAAAATGAVLGSRRKPRVRSTEFSAVDGTKLAIDLRQLVEDNAGDAGALFSITRQPQHGSLSGNVPNLTYLPATGFNGTDSFEFTLTAGGGSSTGVITIQVTAASSPGPVFKAQNSDLTVRVGESVDVLLTVQPAPAEGQVVVFSLTSLPQGTITGQPPRLTYHPPAQPGDDTLTFSAAVDGQDAGTATVRFTVLPPLPDFDWQSVTNGQKLLAGYAACITALVDKSDADFWSSLIGEVSQGTMLCAAKSTAGTTVGRMPYDVQQMVLQVLSELLKSKGGFPVEGEKNYIGARDLEQRLVQATGLPYRLKDDFKDVRPDPLPFYDAAQQLKLADGSPAPRYYQVYAVFLMLRIYTIDSTS